MIDEKKQWIQILLDLNLTRNSVSRILDVSVTCLRNQTVFKRAKIIKSAAVGDEYLDTEQADQEIKDLLEKIETSHPYVKVRILAGIAEKYNPTPAQKENDK